MIEMDGSFFESGKRETETETETETEREGGN